MKMMNSIAIHLGSLLVSFPIVLFLTLLLVFKQIIRRKNAKNIYPPEPPGAWPVVGHLPLLMNAGTNIVDPLSKLADKYGPVFTLRMGIQRAVVVSSKEAVMECFTTNDKFFINRPKSSAGEHFAYNNLSLGFSNGPYWREMRKFVMLEVLSPKTLETMRNLRVSEISMSIKELYQETSTRNNLPVKVGISKWIEQLALNIIVRTIAGIRYGNGSGSGSGSEGKEVERIRGVFTELTFLLGEPVLSDAIPLPFMKMLDVQGHLKSMKRVGKELDTIIEKWIDEHVKRRSEHLGTYENEEKNLIDVMLSTVEENMFQKYGVSKLAVIKATVMNVVLGGFDTMSVYIPWVLALLINNKNVLNKGQLEIDSKIGKQKWVEESDIQNLPYLQSIIKEALRLYPPLPLSLPHQAVQDCHLSGYFIPKNTILFVNVMKLQRDPKIWSDPDKFIPERFLSGTGAHAQVDVLGQQYEFIPFGSGRRSCPGISFAIKVTSLLIARLIQGFDFKPPGGMDHVDMSQGTRITLPRASPLEAMVSPRLDSSLYE